MSCLSFFQNLFKNNSVPNVDTTIIVPNIETEIVNTEIVNTDIDTINIELKIVETNQIDLHDETIIVKWNETTKFLVPINGGKIIKVYDADTITIAAYLPMKDSPLYRFSVRLNGIDTPEIKGKDDDEKEAAKVARDALADKILNKYVVLKNIDTEKYGRILADVYLDDININEWLINKRYAVPYEGGTKISPKSWLKYRWNGEL